MYLCRWNSIRGASLLGIATNILMGMSDSLPEDLFILDPVPAMAAPSLNLHIINS